MIFHERDMLEKRREVLHRRHIDALDAEKPDEALQAKQAMGVYSEEELEALTMKDFTPLPYPEVAQLLVDISRVMADGYGLRQIQTVMGHTWKPFEIKVCTECGNALQTQHHPSCGKRTTEAVHVVEEDCEENDDS
jgi:hypothetical protein